MPPVEGQSDGYSPPAVAAEPASKSRSSMWWWSLRSPLRAPRQSASLRGVLRTGRACANAKPAGPTVSPVLLYSMSASANCAPVRSVPFTTGGAHTCTSSPPYHTSMRAASYVRKYTRSHRPARRARQCCPLAGRHTKSSIFPRRLHRLCAA